MADALQFASVAEGIETEEQCALLQGLGYQYGQGYLFSRPVPADRIAELRAATPAAGTHAAAAPATGTWVASART
jgi:EAL domain-containing protein (putative c-di-GMP-specific phosphodiesterase class I)